MLAWIKQQKFNIKITIITYTHLFIIIVNLKKLQIRQCYNYCQLQIIRYIIYLFPRKCSRNESMSKYNS